MNPLHALRHHVSGAIARGETAPIEEHPVECPGCGEEWNDCICPEIDCHPDEDYPRCEVCGEPIDYCLGGHNDTESVENCDDAGTGEGRWHGRM